MRTCLPITALLCSLLNPVFSVLAQNWSITSLPEGVWTGVACSTNGMKLVVVGYDSGIWVSTNRGTTWVETQTVYTNWWAGVASSADGTKLAAVIEGGFGTIYTSTNSGLTWQQQQAADNFVGIVSSPDGTKLAAVSEDWGAYGIYTSTNSGTNWALTSAVPQIGYFQSVAMSADGTKLAAAGGELSYIGGTTTLTGGGMIDYSTNGGATWNLSDAPTNWEWSTIACSSNGNFMVAGAYGDTNGNPGPVYISRNGGINWTITGAPYLTYGAVACSADGTKITAACFNSYQTISPNGVYTSTNSGTNWTESTTLEDSGSIAYSADGTKIVATTEGGLGLNYVAVSPPLAVTNGPELNIALSSNQVVLYWTTNASGYVLQSTTNISSTNWGNISNGVNTIEGYYVYSNAPSGKAAFFRLKQ